MVATPVARAERISLIDTLRGIALLGILLMNMPFFSGPSQAGMDPFIYDEFTGPNYWCWWGMRVFFNGTMRGIFSMLFGVGMFLLIDRLEQKNKDLTPADVYYRRLVWLGIFGAVDAYLFLWVGDILMRYAITGLFLFPFRNVRPGKLVLYAACFIGLNSYVGTLKIYEAADKRTNGVAAENLQAAHKKLTAKQQAALSAWKEFKESSTTDTLRKQALVEKKTFSTGNYASIRKEILTLNDGWWREHFTNSLYEYLSFFLLGLALYKWNFLTGKQKLWVYLLVGGAGYAFGLTYRILSLKFALGHEFDYSYTVEFIPFDVREFGRLGITLGHVSLIILLYKTGWFAGLWRALARVGQMAFTNYLGQSILCTLFYFGYGFGYFGQLERYQTYEVAGCIWAFQIVFSNVWLYYFLFGPLEWCWRSLTYWQVQPMVRRK
jgi:uncharacterized protein